MANFEFLELIGQPALVLNSDTIILYANAYAIERFRSIANANLQVGKKFITVFEDKELESVGASFLDIIQRLEKTHQNLHTERLRISPHLSLQLSFKNNYDDSIGSYWMITGMNITKQVVEDRKIQTRYKEQLDVFKILFEMAPVGLGIKDFEGGFYKVNQGLSEITGYTKDEILHMHPKELFPDYNFYRDEELLKKLIESDTKSFRQEKIINTASGKKRIVSETINIVKDETSNPFLIIVSYLDLTDEKELQKMLLESRKMEELGKLSGGIAHDFNNMLLPVTLCSDIALQELSDLDLTEFPQFIKIQSYLEKISISAQKAKTLIQKLFQYSQSGKYELTPIMIENEIPKSLDLIYLQKPAHIQVNFQKVEGSYPILGESVWIEQILDNLVVNSFHSMKFKTSGVVNIRLYSEFGDVILEVEDEGTGIEDEELQKIFRPFFTKKKSHEGTGMGLTLVQTMVHKMNGKIRVYSNPGKGTVFQILIPEWNKSLKQLQMNQ